MRPHPQPARPPRLHDVHLRVLLGGLVTAVAVFLALLVGVLAGMYIALSWATSHTDHPTRKDNHHV